MRQIHRHTLGQRLGLIADRCRGNSKFSFTLPQCHGSLWLTLEKKEGECLLAGGGETKHKGGRTIFIMYCLLGLPFL